MNPKSIESHIVNWLCDYSTKSGLNGFVVGVSGGIDSAVTSTLCAKTGLNTIVLNMPIHQKSNQFDRSNEHINWLKNNFENLKDLSKVFLKPKLLIKTYLTPNLELRIAKNNNIG